MKHKLKEERVSNIKSSIVEFLDINKRRCVTFLEMVEFINNGVSKTIKIIRLTTMRYTLITKIRWSLDGKSISTSS